MRYPDPSENFYTTLQPIIDRVSEASMHQQHCRCMGYSIFWIGHKFFETSLPILCHSPPVLFFADDGTETANLQTL